MAYDNVCKYLAEQFPDAFALWLLGRAERLSVLEPSELSTEPIRADSVTLLQSEDRILHIEFQTDPDQVMPLRMLDYWVRLRRRYPYKWIHQVVIYLRFTSSERVYQTELRDQNTHHRFEVLRLWEQDPALLLSSPALLPFVVLSQVADPEEQLRVVAKGIERIPDRRIQSNVTAATAVLAGLSLSETVVEGILEELGMRESVIYQKWRAEALKEGRVEGRAEGRAEGRVEGIRRESEFVLRLLQRRMGVVPEEWLARIRSLPIEQIEALGEALLGFESLTDLEGWLQTHTQGS